MAQDLALLPDYHILRVRLFDMFPHTAHYEVMALLVRR
jgi:SAM-dependent methyltransferases related to tRNA (uracil-5-)-methyltransferase